MHVHLNAVWTVDLLERFLFENRDALEAIPESERSREDWRALSKLKAAAVLVEALKLRGDEQWSGRPDFRAFLIDVIEKAAAARGKEMPVGLNDMKTHELFHQVYGMAVDAIRTPANMEELTFDYLRRAHEQGVVYTEISTSALNNVRADDPDAAAAYEKNMDAICRAIQRANKKFGIEARVIVTDKRHLGPRKAAELLDMCLDHRRKSWLAKKYVTGWGMAGDEHQFSLGDFAETFKKAKASGLGTTVHVGEVPSTDVSEIKQAIEVLGVDRIGHGIKAATDEATLELIRNNGVAVEQCPTSNYLLEEVINGNPSEHPLNRFRKAGCDVVLGSDDPALLFPSGQNTAHGIADEYAHIGRNLGLSARERIALTRNAINHAFIDSRTRRKLLRKVHEQELAYYRSNKMGRDFSHGSSRFSRRVAAHVAHIPTHRKKAARAACHM